MNIPIDKVTELVDMQRAEIRMVSRLFGVHSDSSDISFETLLIVLIWDFFKRSGMALESFASALPPFTERFKIYSDQLLTAIDKYTTEHKTNIPRGFVTLIDNRYVGIYFDSSEPIKLWDMVEDKWAGTLVTYKPVFTLTLSVPMLYFKVAARNFGHVDIAEASKKPDVWVVKEST